MKCCWSVGLLVCVWPGSAVAQAQPEPLPAPLVQAWEKAGAKTGWLGQAKGGDGLLFSAKLDSLKVAGVVPAFRFSRWHSGRIGTLPTPDKAFGLSFQDTRMGSGLKELAGLKNLAALRLDGTQVTDAGLKELAALNNLAALDLRRTKVTDAGLKELAALNNLAALDLRGTKVTDAGLKGLARLNNLAWLSLRGTQGI